MNLRIFETPHDAGIYVAAMAEQVVKTHRNPVLGLATGTTPIPFYEAFVEMYRDGLDLSHVTTINLDEYTGLEPSHNQSYSFFMKKHLFSKINIPSENIHIPNGVAPDLEAECRRYETIISQHPINFQVLGIGVNGHIGFNEPDDLLESKTHIVQLRDETVKSNARFFEHVEDVPRQAITLGMQAILRADKIVLMAFGTGKANIVAQAILGSVRTDVPASILQLHTDVTFVLDRASASPLLDEEGHLTHQVRSSLKPRVHKTHTTPL